jgi:hypothetical protein
MELPPLHAPEPQYLIPLADLKTWGRYSLPPPRFCTLPDKDELTEHKLTTWLHSLNSRPLSYWQWADKINIPNDLDDWIEKFLEMFETLDCAHITVSELLNLVSKFYHNL